LKRVNEITSSFNFSKSWRREAGTNPLNFKWALKSYPASTEAELGPPQVEPLAAEESFKIRQEVAATAVWKTSASWETNGW